MVTLTQIEQRISHLQKKAEDLRRKKSASVIASIRKMMAEHGLSIADIAAAVEPAPRKRGRPAGSKEVTRQTSEKTAEPKAPAKYRDPVTGATWSGRARPPAWIKDAKDRSKFLIDQTSQKGPVKTTKRKRAAA